MNPYQPEELPLNALDWRLLFGLVGQANAELARYDGLLQAIINPAVMLSPLTTQEAVLSSRIEGTQATVDEVLEHEAGMEREGEKGKDIQEIINYRSTLRMAHDSLTDRPITLGFVREIHRNLLNSVRGQNKTPGEFRTDQNWIGRPGATREEATFVPPSPLQLHDHLEAWQRYVESDDIDFVLQTAVVHAQFELIHPFKDGNGRIGRLLIPLFLYRKKKLSQPMFYLSSYLEQNRDEYYQRLRDISGRGDWNGWIAFFMRAVTIQSKENISKVKASIQLYGEMKARVQEITHSQYSMNVLDFMFNRPIFRPTDFVNESGIHEPTAHGLLRQIRDAGILVELQPRSGRRPGVLCFPALLRIVEGKDVV